jgi:putative nucleotidyltransferase with HDIG domain
MSTCEHSSTIRFSDLISALSVALDLTEGQPMGHAVRSCIVGMRIAEEMRLPETVRADLYYALLLKDAGCSTNSARLYKILGADEIKAKREIKLEDWTKVSVSGFKYLLRNTLSGASLSKRLMRALRLGLEQDRNNAELIGARCERGADIAIQLGLSDATAQAIRSLDEHWDGGGYGHRLQANAIPLLSRIINVSQTMEVFGTEQGPLAATQVVQERSGTWFDPEIARVVRGLEKDKDLWGRLRSTEARDFVMQMEPGICIQASPERIDSICRAFAGVIDAKSPYTYRHSVGVAEAAVVIAEALALAPETVTLIRRAALLHDIGKLSVSNAILEKPGLLSEAEWMTVKMHPVYTRQILKMIAGFEQLAFVASAHHERLDGSGYPDGLKEEQMPLVARIICVADVFQALTEERPYRAGLPLDVVFGIMEGKGPDHLDPVCLAVLKRTAAAKIPREQQFMPLSKSAAAR